MMDDKDIKLEIVRIQMTAAVEAIHQGRPSPDMDAFLGACQKTYDWIKNGRS